LTDGGRASIVSCIARGGAGNRSRATRLHIGDWIGQDGAIYGFNTVMFYLPSKQATIVISGNKSTNFSSETLDMFLPIAENLYPGSISP
jgi:hypothetical protein